MIVMISTGYKTVRFALSTQISRWTRCRRLSGETKTVLLCERDGARTLCGGRGGRKIVGYGALNLAKTEISSVFVDPAYQRTGVGRAILSALEELAQDEGLEAVQLQATGTAIIFYLATGYQSDPPVEPGVEWALMKKKLC